MICVELSFTGTPERLAARPGHRAFLGTLYGDGRLHAAGPWADDSGALLVFTVDRRAVDEIVAQDPYYSTPGVTIKSIREWKVITGTGAQ